MAEDGQFQRVVMVMVNELTMDNVCYARETMEKTHNLNPENISDVIDILLNYWFTGERKL